MHTRDEIRKQISAPDSAERDLEHGSQMWRKGSPEYSPRRGLGILTPKFGENFKKVCLRIAAVVREKGSWSHLRLDTRNLSTVLDPGQFTESKVQVPRPFLIYLTPSKSKNLQSKRRLALIAVFANAKIWIH